MLQSFSPGKPAKNPDGPRSRSSGGNHAIDERSLEEAVRRCCHKFSLQLVDEIRPLMRRRGSEAFMPREITESTREKTEATDYMWTDRGISVIQTWPQDELVALGRPKAGEIVIQAAMDALDADRIWTRAIEDGLVLPKVVSLAGDQPSPGKPVGDSAGHPDAGPESDDDDDNSQGSGSTRRYSSANVFESRDSENSDGERRSTYRQRRASEFPGVRPDQRLSSLRHSEQKREIENVLRAARLSRLPRQSLQISDMKMPIHYSCCGKVLSMRSPDIMKEDTLDFFMGVLVVVNMAQLGIRADCERDWQGWLIVECLFAIAFLIEFTLRIIMRGIYNHFIVHWMETLLDGIIVVAALVELISTLTGEAKLGPGAQTLTILRVVRLLRLVRIVKALRLPMFKDLMMMCEGLIGGSQTLFCSIILLMVPIYSAALFMREVVGTDETNKEIVKPFTSLPWSFFTTFRCIMGDCSAETGQPLPELLLQKIKGGWLFGVIYMALILITFLGVFNVIIAIYVEQIVVSARKNESLQKRRRLGDVKRMDLLLANLVHEFVKAKMADDRDSQFFQTFTNQSTMSADVPHVQALDAEQIAKFSITKKVFEETMNTEDVQSFLEQLGIPAEDRWNLFDILDADGTGSLHLGEIVEGFKKLRGEPRRSDVVANGLSIRAMQKRVHSETESIFTFVKRIAINVECIRQDHIEDIEMILDKLGKIEEFIGGSAKVPSTPNTYRYSNSVTPIL